MLNQIFKKLSITKKNTSNEEKFWDWFLANKTQIEKFMDSDLKDLTIYNKLTKQIKKYNNLLFPELTKTEDDKYVLIITPDGMREGIIPTQTLFDTKPDLENWQVHKFRQPTNETKLNFNGTEFPVSDIEVIPNINKEQEKVDLRVFIRGMNNDPNNYQTLAFLYFDHILGEYNTITKVGFIDFYHLEESKSVQGGKTLLELREIIEDNLY